MADVFDVFALFIHDLVTSRGYGKVGISLGVRKISFIRRSEMCLKQAGKL